MASFVIHYIAGEKFLQKLEERGAQLTEEQKNQFLLGNLIVDSSKIKTEVSKDLSKEELKELKRIIREQKQNEKIKTHFRDESDIDYCIQAPKISKFLSAYEDLAKTDFSALGYLYHLYTDKMFFDDLFTETFECLDIYGSPTEYIKSTVYMRIKKNEAIYHVKDFWDNSNPLSIYQDYTAMNKILLEYYGTTFDNEKLLEYATDSLKNPGIEEVNYENINSVMNKTASFINESYQAENSTLNIFSETTVKDFITKIAGNFCDEYGFIVEPHTKKSPVNVNMQYQKEA